MNKMSLGCAVALLFVGIFGYWSSQDELAKFVVADQEASRLLGGADGRYLIDANGGCGSLANGCYNPDTQTVASCAQVADAYWAPFIGALGRTTSASCTACGSTCGSYDLLWSTEE